ncbi:MAG TPA: dihydrofolate reductase family protein [Kofleriaceae bacterium]|nr:dihydrofolate reductase family protein [Kofleriaceae bacterium]
MGKLRFNLSISLDGFLAGPQQSPESPLGVGGEHLHDWVFPLAAWRGAHGGEGGIANASTQIVEEMTANVGAVIMGRNMFGGHPGAWTADPPWTGWWGEDPPFHVPVFVVTHHAREALPMKGGTTFHFVTDGIDSAVAKARAAAGDKDISIGGGASVARQLLAAGHVDEVNITLVPLFLGSGERLFDQLGTAIKLEQVRVIDAPGVTHLKYRVVK